MRIFFSWQSDLDPDLTQRPIRQELKAACLDLERKHEDCTFNPDEATRNLPGSPNIMQAIFQKIAQADAFVCDLTPVARTESGKAVANPNVLIELGFAIATLGWERIVLLVNTHLGQVPSDLPFDVEKHRASSFTVKAKDDKSGRGELKALLRVAVEEIFRREPQKPTKGEAESPEQSARRRDVRELTRLMEHLPIKQIENCISELPTYWNSDLGRYHESFEWIVDTGEFHLACETTAAVLEQLRVAWKNIDRYHDYFYTDGGRHAKFEIKAFEVSPREFEEGRQAYETLYKDRLALFNTLQAWTRHLHASFPELDISVTSETAREYYRELDRKFEASFSSRPATDSGGV